MPKTEPIITKSIDKWVASQSLFSEKNQQINKVKPLYLFCAEEANNKLFFFISDASTHCWIKKANGWEKLEIKDLLLARDGGSRIYCFKQNADNIDILNIPYPLKNNAKYTSLNEDKTVILTTITLSQEELDGNNITHLEDLDLKSIPETKKQAQQQIELAEKKQAAKRDIQNVEVVISLIQRALEKIQKLEAPDRESIEILSNQIRNYKKIKSDLCEKQHLLENSPEVITQTVGAMRI